MYMCFLFWSEIEYVWPTGLKHGIQMFSIWSEMGYGLKGKELQVLYNIIIKIIIWMNWSIVKRSILIGSLRGLYFAIRNAKMDCSQTDFNELCSFQKETFWQMQLGRQTSIKRTQPIFFPV